MTREASLLVPHKPVEAHTLRTLVNSLREYLGPKSGINSEDVSVAKLKSLLAAYHPTSNEWLDFGVPDPSRNYTRLLVDSINGKSNLLFIVWNPHRKSPIHDHANAHCVMKILKCSLKETVYEVPASKNSSQQEMDSPLKTSKETVYSEGEVTYISDNIGLHNVSNPNDEIAVSLHLYTPPNAAEFGYNIYDEKTGRSSHVR